MSTSLRLVVFDVDGTLVDSQAHIIAAMQRSFGAAGVPEPSRSDILGIIGLSLPVAIERLAPSVEPDQKEMLMEGYKSSFIDLRAERSEAAASPLYPGALEALDLLAKQEETLLGIATGKSRRGLEHVLGAHDLHGRFVTMQVADDHPSKPHPSMLHRALEETGTDARNAVMIGDTTYDMEMARAAGLTGIGVAWGYHAAEDLMRAGADRVIDGFVDLGATLSELLDESR